MAFRLGEQAKADKHGRRTPTPSPPGRKTSPPCGCGSKNRYQIGTLVSGKKTTAVCPSWLILSHAHVARGFLPVSSLGGSQPSASRGLYFGFSVGLAVGFPLRPLLPAVWFVGLSGFLVGLAVGFSRRPLLPAVWFVGLSGFSVGLAVGFSLRPLLPSRLVCGFVRVFGWFSGWVFS